MTTGNGAGNGGNGSGNGNGDPPPQPPVIVGDRAVLVNRQYLRWIEVRYPHTITDNGSSGWRLTSTHDQVADVVVHMVDETVRLRLAEGDYALADGQELYITLAEEPPLVSVEVEAGGGGSVDEGGASVGGNEVATPSAGVDLPGGEATAGTGQGA